MSSMATQHLREGNSKRQRIARIRREIVAIIPSMVAQIAQTLIKSSQDEDNQNRCTKPKSDDHHKESAKKPNADEDKTRITEEAKNELFPKSLNRRKRKRNHRTHTNNNSQLNNPYPYLQPIPHPYIPFMLQPTYPPVVAFNSQPRIQSKNLSSPKSYQGVHPHCATCNKHHPLKASCRTCTRCGRYGHWTSACRVKTPTLIN